MKRFYFLLAASLFLSTPITAVAGQEVACPSTTTAQSIDALELKSWIDTNQFFVLLDARTAEYDDNQRIPGAIWMPFNSSEDLLKETIGSVDTPIVVYCSCLKCPASVWLAIRLIKMGYTNVYEFHEGIDGWVAQGFPVTHG
jgi:Rhodanese-related sulfurtransferase